MSAPPARAAGPVVRGVVRGMAGSGMAELGSGGAAGAPVLSLDAGAGAGAGSERPGDAKGDAEGSELKGLLEAEKSSLIWPPGSDEPS